LDFAPLEVAESKPQNPVDVYVLQKKLPILTPNHPLNLDTHPSGENAGIPLLIGNGKYGTIFRNALVTGKNDVSVA